MEYPEHPTIKQLGGRVVDLLRHPNSSNVDWSAFNPSIGHNGKSIYATTIRSSNYHIDKLGRYVPNFGDTFLTKTYFSEFDKDWGLKKLRLIDFDGLDASFGGGVQDCKLFYRDGWHFTGVVAEGWHAPSSRMAIFKLDARKCKVVSYEKFAGRDAKIPEKNWMIPGAPTNNFDWVYGANQVVVGGVLQTWLTDSETVQGLRGSSNLVEFGEDTYLAVMHRTSFSNTSPYVATTFTTSQSNLRDYVHHFVLLDKYGYILEVTPGFRFHQPGVEYAAGLVFKGNQAIVSFGRNDVSSHLAFINKDTVLKLLRPVLY